MVSRYYKSLLKCGLLLLFAVVNIQCGQFKSSDETIRGIDRRISPTHVGPDEPSYCVGPTLYTNPYVINGVASYEYRVLEYTSTFKGLGEISETPNPIRYAEFVVINNLGQIIQCGETNEAGQFSFNVPSNGQVFRLQIRSRADNNFFKASVLRSPESNEIYVLEKSFAATTNRTFDLVAKAKGDLLAGAFHILDEIYSYNAKLRTAAFAGTCPTSAATGCIPFDVAPKVQVYWEKGFNPGSYFSQSQISSFYYQGLRRLFILGGINGDVNYSDTDHFDKSIIAHEYFHFLEDVYSKSTSPGGGHNGNQLLDPRLAWSEGVAQFFQAAMTGINRVLDTVGNIDGSSQLIVNYSVEHAENDVPVYEGEGEFREFSVARMLWDMYDTNNESPNPNPCASIAAGDWPYSHDKCTQGNFNFFWSVLTGGNSFNNDATQFISVGAFHQHYVTNDTSARTRNLQPLAVYEKQTQNRSRYGQRLTTCGAATTFSMSTPFVANVSGQMFDSHPVANKRYYYIQHTGGSLVIRLTASLNSTESSFTVMPDLYLYPQDHIVGSSQPLHSNVSNLVYDPITPPSKSLVFDTALRTSYLNDSNPNNDNIAQNSLPAGNYLIVVNVRNFNSSNGALNLNFASGATAGSLGNLCAAL